MNLISALSALVVVSQVLASPVAVKVPNGEVIPNSYIVALKPTAKKASHLKELYSLSTRGSGSSARILHDYSNVHTVFHGYSAILTDDALQHVLASSDVEYVEANVIVSLHPESVDSSQNVTKINEQEPQPRACTKEIDVYILDTGVYTSHPCFAGSASWGATFGGYANADGNGHGTHTAGIVACQPFGGVACVHVIAVKVLSDGGSGTVADVIAGVNYVYNSYLASGHISLAIMNLGGSVSTALDSAVANAIAGGLHFVIGAGNSNTDASNYSPPRVPTANTIGAIDSSNAVASFSNYGSVIDVWAPGVNIKSAWIGSTTATNALSGTSTSSGFVAGILATALLEYGSVSPASLSSSLRSHAQAVVTGVPSGTTNLKATLW